MSEQVLVPIKLDAFVLNEHVCDGKDEEAKIAPITQPNYTFLRLQNFYIQNDLLNHIDLHAASPSAKNPRITDLRTGETRRNRKGVHLHWILPRLFRSTSIADDESNDAQDIQGSPKVPTRWLVVRRLKKGSYKPEGINMDEFEAWVVESDRRRNIEEDLTEKDDMQTDVSPFVAAGNDGQASIAEQAEVFIGKKTPLTEWVEIPSAPRIALSLFNSSNPLFADYQPHNSNVFSIIDPLEDENGLKLSKGTVSYYVVGWHPVEEDDPFSGPRDSPHEKVMQSLSLAFKEPSTERAKAWLRSSDATRMLCHGAMYDVEWGDSQKPRRVLADELSKKLNEELPVAVGETPLDALLAFVDSHKAINSGRIDALEKCIDTIRLLMRTHDDGPEAQRAAENQQSSAHYMKEDGGIQFHLLGTHGSSRTADDAKQSQRLSLINEAQTLLDSANRTQVSLQWELFSLWWKYLSDVDGRSKEPIITPKVQDVYNRLLALEAGVNQLADFVNNETAGLPDAKPGAKPPFCRALDPTLMVGGIGSGWAHDFLDPLQVRLSFQIISGASGSDLPRSWLKMLKEIEQKIPPILAPSAVSLLNEFLSLDPSVLDMRSASSAIPPLFHDQAPTSDGSSSLGWRDRWEGTQPWFPLFMEWEAEYTHIPFENWELQETTSSRSTVEKVVYHIREGVDLEAEKLDDPRLVAGRTLILPQPGQALNLIISELFAQMPPNELDKVLPPVQREALLVNIKQLAFLSAPFSGFIDHLTTRTPGSHIRPSVRRPDGSTDFREASLASQNAGFTMPILKAIGSQTSLTPYGTAVPVARDTVAFRAATHGQFRITKVNIVDKFGQVIHGLKPSVPRNEAPPLYPCISEGFRPQVLKENPTIANTVRRDAPGKCEYVQLPPRLNQPARLNAWFVDVQPAAAPLPPNFEILREDESPVWGWVVINFADKGLQVFLPDGSFYREIRFGGPKGTLESDNWLPFGPPKKDSFSTERATARMKRNMAQLHALIQKLTNPEYLNAFINAILQSLRNSPAAPNAYAESLNCIIGKPLALVNAAWSIELASSPYSNQSDFPGTSQTDIALIPESHNVEQYKFPLKIGGRNQLFDGLIGYFHLNETSTPDGHFDLDRFYTYFVENNTGPGDPRQKLEAGRYPKVPATWTSPFSQQGVSGRSELQSYSITKPRSYSESSMKDMLVVGALIDPFLPVNAYTSVFPPTPLQLLPWVWQDALTKMSAFFHVGPLIMTKDIPPFQKDRVLTDAWYDTKPVKSEIRTHTMEGKEWAWLQPYFHKKTEDDTAQEAQTTQYMPLTVDRVEPRLRMDAGPYTAIEGFLQIRNSLSKFGSR